MSKKTIAKFFAFVIPAVVVSYLSAACAFVSSEPVLVRVASRYGAPEVVGKIKSSDVIESSGIAASRCQSDVFWTHNDSGDGAYLFAFNKLGDNLGTWRVQNAENRDWEDIATWKDRNGKCFIYIGEIGDNDLLWPEHIIYRVMEPLMITGRTVSTRDNPTNIEASGVLRYAYPDGDKNAETLMVHPGSGDIYVLTKQESGPAGVYRLKGDFSQSNRSTAKRIVDLSVPNIPNGLLTGGDISPDGRSVVVCDYRQAYELNLPASSDDFDEIWKQKPFVIDIGKHKVGEAIGYSVDGSEIYATSEGRNSPIIVVRRRN